VEVWSRGIDAARFNPGYRSDELRRKLGEGKFIFLYVGRLSPEKGIDLLLSAAAEIEHRFPGKTVFVFTGDGPCTERIRRRGLPNTALTGFKTGGELSSLYASADCFAFPSGTETFGNAALEAMASGLPVAGVAGGGVTDFLFHGRNSLLCACDDGEAFTQNLITFMEDSALRLRLAKNALADAQQRDWNVIFDGLMRVYSSLVAEKQKQYRNAA
jgi:glycosyltransferase involved in cell wall biosynthesis